jgi:acyl dehydratase
MQTTHRHIGPLSLEQIVRFAGAVQDFNPIHYDEHFARAAGLPGIVAQGPLTYLIALDSLIAANGLSKISGFQARLKAPVTPGMSLSLSCDANGKVSLKAGDHEALVGTVKAAAGEVT